MITLSKIAKLANVSVSTASKAFAGSKEVNEETREMIFDIAKKNGCFKRFYNAKYPKFVIAVITHEFNGVYYTRYLSLLKSIFDKMNCELCVSISDFSAENEKKLIEYYYKHSNVDGIIVMGPYNEIAEDYEIPIVYINSTTGQTGGISVAHDLRPALCQCVDYLICKKANSIGFIGEKLTRGKFELFEQALNEKGLKLNENFVSITDRRFEEGGYHAMEKLFSKKQLPRAIICAYDNMAIGAIRCIYDHGLSVPKDIAVLGIDDIPESKYLNPPLASLSTPTEKLCQLAADAVIKQIKGETVEPRQIISSEFNLRRSFEIF